MLTDEGREFLEKNEIKNYSLNQDGTVDVVGDVKIKKTNQSKLPVKFRKITGYFYCGHDQLISIDELPSHVSGSFYYHSESITSLHDIHKYVKEINGQFFCHIPKEGAVLGLILIKGIKQIYLGNYRVQMILNKYLGQGRAGVIGAQQELLDADLDEYARL